MKGGLEDGSGDDENNDNAIFEKMRKVKETKFREANEVNWDVDSIDKVHAYSFSFASQSPTSRDLQERFERVPLVPNRGKQHLKPPATFPGSLHTPKILLRPIEPRPQTQFDAFWCTKPRECARWLQMLFPPAPLGWGRFPQISAGFEGQIRGGRKRGKSGKESGKRKKERDKRDGEKQTK